jgi:hypothetical protein
MGYDGRTDGRGDATTIMSNANTILKISKVEGEARGYVHCERCAVNCQIIIIIIITNS